MQAKLGLRARISRAIHLIVLTFFVVASTSVTPAMAGVPRAYAGIVIDAKTGNTLYSYAADSARYPASVTKVMTLYILFQELAAGRMTLSTRLRVSAYAAKAVPTKLYVRAGSTIKVEDAIKSLVTVSANDVARVIAENISGSESKFAERMTRTARALGMSRTTYTNASGLPSTRQVTTVRDQARLGMALFQHFPQYYKYFQTRSFTYAGKTYGNHNRLLGRNGVDGIKTGYTRASGFNLLTAARKDGRHIIVVGFGFSTGSARNTKVAELVAKYLRQARSGSYWAQAAIPEVSISGTRNVLVANRSVTPMPRPAGRDVADLIPSILTAEASIPANPNANIDAGGNTRSNLPVLPAPPISSRAVTAPVAPLQVASLEAPTQLIPSPAVQATAMVAGVSNLPQSQPVDVIGAWLSDNFRIGPRGGDQLQPSGGNILLPPALIGASSQQAIDLMTSGAIGADATPPPTNRVAWIVQIGAPPSAQGAEAILNTATSRISALTDYRSYVERVEKTGQTFYRARFAGFADRDQAVSICEQIREENLSCLAVQS